MKFDGYFIYFVFIVFVREVCCESNENISVQNATAGIVEENSEVSEVLSRRKRFLIFPDGSSFQLVFCVQTAALIPIGDIFLYSSTAALAWNLPTDPMFLYMFKGYLKDAQRRGDVQHHIYYVNDENKIVAKIPYKRKPIVNPAFAKRSIDTNETFKQKLKLKIDRMKMHEKQVNRDYLKRVHMDANAIEFHRSSRVGLFEKLETLFTALGHDGRQCVLYRLCEAAQSSHQQGSFFEELLNIVFTLPKGSEFESDAHKEYDKAHAPSENCTAQYSGCEDFRLQTSVPL